MFRQVGPYLDHTWPITWTLPSPPYTWMDQMPRTPVRGRSPSPRRLAKAFSATSRRKLIRASHPLSVVCLFLHRGWNRRKMVFQVLGRDPVIARPTYFFVTLMTMTRLYGKSMMYILLIPYKSMTSLNWSWSYKNTTQEGKGPGFTGSDWTCRHVYILILYTSWDRLTDPSRSMDSLAGSPGPASAGSSAWRDEQSGSLSWCSGSFAAWISAGGGVPHETGRWITAFNNFSARYRYRSC